VAFSLAHQVVANSESVRRKLLEAGVNKSRITVIHNGLDLERVMASENLSRDETLSSLGLGHVRSVPRHFVTIVANMRHDIKDYPMFLHAAQQVNKAVPDAGFLLAGEGELQSSIADLAAQLGIADHTFLLGRCENVGQLLAVSDVCVLSSKAEGFSNSILEYMAAGRPVVATDVGGAREAIVEGETGHLVPAGNSQLMADRIVSLLGDPERSRAMGAKGRCIVEQKFSTQTLLQNTEALYEKLLTGRRATQSDKLKFVEHETG
jgi:L-malate glycosyltransferase